VRVFLDTNVLVSAFASRGICADLLELVLLDHDLVTGNQVLHELDRALRDKVRLPPAQRSEVIDFIRGAASAVVEDGQPVDAAVDADDALVPGEALSGSSGIFVTGDGALLRLKAVATLKIVSPRRFWEALHERSE
jgi:putative PIN family toxin of toxin-antitoxin system